MRKLNLKIAVAVFKASLLASSLAYCEDSCGGLGLDFGIDSTKYL